MYDKRRRIMKNGRISLRVDKDSINTINIIMECCGCSKTDAIQLALDMTIGSFSCAMMNFHYHKVYKPNHTDRRTVKHNDIE